MNEGNIANLGGKIEIFTDESSYTRATIGAIGRGLNGGLGEKTWAEK